MQCKVSTHYRIVSLYSLNICQDVFVSYELLDFFCNMFNSKAVKLGCIIRCTLIITIHISSFPMSVYWFKIIKIITHAPSFILGKLLLEKAALNLG